jgi:hypothetical protein
VSTYTRPDGLIARTDTSTPCRCGRPDCGWTEADDIQRDRMEWAQAEIDAEDKQREGQ